MATKSSFIPGQVPNHPLEKIALSLSGGGYRAASFHLGGMSYLNKLIHNGKPVLQHVEMISTVSGGTIPGVVYTLMLQNGNSFEECYHFLLEKLGNIDLVASGIDKLNPGSELKNPNKAKNLINAFAEQYDEHFTGGATMEQFSTMKGHLKSVVFNATEFTNAINFRFRNPDPYLKTGNDAFRIPGEISKEIKLSDVIASSSCFPGGFEPLLWPNDYVHQDSPQLEQFKAYNEQNQINPTGIMDGGIYDNQGVESIMMYKNGMETPYFDLIMVSDVASPDMNAYRAFTEKPKIKNWKSLTLSQLQEKGRSVFRAVNLTLGLLIAITALLPLLWGYSNTIFTGLCLAVTLIATAIYFIKNYAVKLIKAKYQKTRTGIFKLIPSFYFEKLSRLNIGEISFHRVEPLLINRAKSLLNLASVIFLKVIRRLNYKRLYEHPNYEFRRSTTLIKELTEKDWTAKHPKLEYSKEVGSKLKEVIEQAAEFGTTLWFTDEEKLGKMLELLVVTGQVTMCYNMKVYLEELTTPAKEGKPAKGFENLATETKLEIMETLAQCNSDWETFKAMPYHLFQAYDITKNQYTSLDKLQ